MSLHLPFVELLTLAGLVAALAFVVSAACAWVFTRVEHPLIPIDRPNHRSLHTHPVARIGGVAICAGVVLALLLPPLAGLDLPVATSERALTTILVTALLLVAMCFIDDHRSLPVGLRFATHFGCAGAVLAALNPAAGWPLWAALVLGIVWMTNLYNFMDGSDGLAGSITLIGFACLGLAAGSAGAPGMAIACAAVAGAAAAFVLFNWSPARAFMGDTGSIPLGFLASSLGVAGWVQGLWPLFFAPLVFAPFVADASVTLLRRLARGERIWQAHRSHYYQRLVLMGWGHATVARLYAAATLASGLAALALREVPPAGQIMGAGLVLAALALAGYRIDRRWQAHAPAR